MINWSIFLAALGSTGIEFLEVVAIAYAIGSSGYVREAIWGSLVGLIVVLAVAIALGNGLQFLPLQPLQILIGSLLLWFGWGWAKKSVSRLASGRRAGWIDDQVLEKEGITLDQESPGFSKLNFLIMTKSVALEALEIVVIVITLGLATSAWYEAIAGTGLALLLSLVMIIFLHQYLLKLPEVLIKLGAGVMLSAMGTFWLGEGIGLEFPFDEFFILILITFYSFTAVFSVYWLKNQLVT
ncbi:MULTISPECIES: COG4280 domain-containing protein [Cyanophyceae]|uniref:COG4280 domain-containing protein n=1 Tax=Cyanophyceae TaxID=3028117 RepID=UPI00232E6928|nr:MULTISPECIES: COG4280 domain-containing protein [Cyanophyceae]MDB9356707.1 COG4280 domain-containing protein [Nodularia spumigena CS-587/03]MDB9341620.1 COG4280 domain-containing protein [Nodularia spumigena CS-589/07]MDB9345431.1 COG4280 domain-containing protein [Nodularia spumigena CS-588/06]MDB9367688.1 COG4280 domain-containing protein [Nodularia spumigena CS-586/05]MDB9399139.1 COG4280 domain-containing protein [Microcystis aeruginosa CS-567/02-A1]